MKMTILISTALLLLVGCAHSLKHGTIAMKESDTMSHVSIHDVKAGDRLILFRSVCQDNGGEKNGGAGRSCQRVQLAEGTVKNVFNEHYSSVEFPTGTKFAEGDFVETAAK